MRIADTLLRRGHLSEDALIDAWYSGDRPAHLDRCDICAGRALDLARWLSDTRQMGFSEADAAFPPEKLAAQQSQIMRRLEQMDRPAKLLSFPRASAAVDGLATRRAAIGGWIAAGVAAGIVLGVAADRFSMWERSQQAAAPIAAPATASAKDTSATSDRRIAEDLLNGEPEQPELRSLSAIDSLTPQATVVRADNRRRR